GYVEADLSKELRNLIVVELKKLGVTAVVDNDNETLQQVINRLNPTEKDVCLDIHWNAGPPTATGVETFIPDRHNFHEKA
ncbi:N-acetylmuramoyl-L-alanine amidase, partial [Listeria monocytogenes]|uniref:N-acetylmuramoyl-L-alanine amidase n=1 Tax=Listeria monocytogenes TaxID=1639 RepID=UPI002FDBFD9A